MRSLIVIVVILILLGVLVAFAHGVWQPSETVVQPIAFNHKIHVESASLQCINCHTDAASRVWAGLPDKDACLDCHDPDDEETQTDPEKSKLIRFADSDENIPWRRVAILRPDVFFSHRRHVSAAGLKCEQCHRGQAELTAPPETPALVMRMNDCLNCHKKNNVTTDCLACHR